MPVLTRSMTRFTERLEALNTALKYAEKYNEATDAETRDIWCLRFMAFVLVNKYIHQLLQTNRVFYDSVVENVRAVMKTPNCSLLLYQYCYAVKLLTQEVQW